MKPATSLCCLRRSVENRRCTTTSPPTATSIATATINRPVMMRIIGSLLAGIALARWVSTLSSEEHNAIDAWLPRTSENPHSLKLLAGSGVVAPPLYCCVSHVRTKRVRSCVHKKHNTRRYGRTLAGSLGPIGVRLCTLSRRREPRLNGVLRSSLRQATPKQQHRYA